MNCGFCKKKLTLEVIDLGNAPITNNLLKKLPKKNFKYTYPLKVFVCDKCWLVQNKDKINAKKIFTKNYPYFSSFSSSWLKHADNLTTKIINRFNLNKTSLVAEVASNDGYLLQYLKKKKIPCFGIEPTKSTGMSARKRGIKVFQKFFNTETSKNLSKRYKADIIIALNVLAHVPNIKDFIKSFKILLKNNGVAIFEFHYVINLIKKKQFDTIYHEHYYYHSLFSLNLIFKKFKLKIFDAEKIKSHGGSLRLYVKNIESKKWKDTIRYKKIATEELALGINKYFFYKKIKEDAVHIKNKFRKFLENCKLKNQSVVGYGAAAKGITLINYSRIDKELMQYIIDKNPAKQNMFLPQSNIEITGTKILKKNKPDYVIILPWNLKNEIVKELNFIKIWGGKFVVFVPKFKII
jgi:2-polyprenyl-3-methyl-5-hydroxy-6-metoxy-1,4-benzoquinol methylase